MEAVTESVDDETSVETFVENLKLLHQVNLLECITRYHCELRCNATLSEGTSSAVDEAAEQLTDDLPFFLTHFLQGGRIGQELARTQECPKCEQLYPKCSDEDYNYTLSTNELFNQLMDAEGVNMTAMGSEEGKPEESVDAYLRQSLEFLEMANLTTCYALVNCETTCEETKAGHIQQSPTKESPIFADDPDRPACIATLHEGILLGYQLAKDGKSCEDCKATFNDCEADKYLLAKSSAQLISQTV